MNENSAYVLMFHPFYENNPSVVEVYLDKIQAQIMMNYKRDPEDYYIEEVFLDKTLHSDSGPKQAKIY